MWLPLYQAAAVRPRTIDDVRSVIAWAEQEGASHLVLSMMRHLAESNSELCEQAARCVLDSAPDDKIGLAVSWVPAGPLHRWLDCQSPERIISLVALCTDGWPSDACAKLWDYLDESARIHHGAGFVEANMLSDWLVDVDPLGLSGGELVNLTRRDSVRRVLTHHANPLWRFAAALGGLTDGNAFTNTPPSAGTLPFVTFAASALLDPQLLVAASEMIEKTRRWQVVPWTELAYPARRVLQLAEAPLTTMSVRTMAAAGARPDGIATQLMKLTGPVSGIADELAGYDRAKADELLWALERGSENQVTLRRLLTRNLARLLPDHAVASMQWLEFIPADELAARAAGILIHVPVTELPRLFIASTAVDLLDWVRAGLDGDDREFWTLFDSWSGSLCELVETIRAARR